MSRWVFFDGVCNLCNFWVRFLQKVDRKGSLNMASLQSELAKEKLQLKIIEVDSVVYLRDDEIFLESNAILMILKDIGGFSKFLYWLLRLFPFRFRQFVYRWVARNRYKWFGTCSLD